MDPSGLLQVDIWGKKEPTQDKRRRPKVLPENRRRTSTACDHCRSRRVKCTGEQPCRQCEISKTTCIYPPNVPKVHVPEQYIDSLQKQIAALDKCLQEAIPDVNARSQVFGKHEVKLHTMPTAVGSLSYVGAAPISPQNVGGNFPSTPGSRTPVTSSGEYEFEDDYTGIERYTHNSTTFGFLEGISDVLRTSSQQSWASPAVLEQLASFGVFATSHLDNLEYLTPFPGNISTTMIENPYAWPAKQNFLSCFNSFASYFGSGSINHGATGGGIFHWFSSSECMRDIEVLYGRSEVYIAASPVHTTPAISNSVSLGILNMTLALGLQATETEWMKETSDSYGDLPSPTAPRVRAKISARDTYFCRAKSLLANPLENISRQSLRLLSMLAFYLLADVRKDTGYLYIGVAVNMAVALNLHRASTEVIDRSSSDLGDVAAAAQKAIENEERKREFWNVYILDRMYSVVTGRPVLLSDEDIDVELPCETTVGSLPSGAGLAAHAKLSRISGKLVSNVYGIRRSAGIRQGESITIVQHIDRIHATLNSWSETLSPELQLVNGVAPNRSIAMLHLLHSQLYILSSRPALVLATRRKLAGFGVPFGHPSGGQTPPGLHVQTCVNAAQRIFVLTRQLQAANWISIHAMTDFYFIFNAVLVFILAQVADGSMGIHNNVNIRDEINFSISFLSDLAAKGNESAGICATIATELYHDVQKIQMSTMPMSTTMVEVPDVIMTSAGYPYGGVSHPSPIFLGSMRHTSEAYEQQRDIPDWFPTSTAYQE